jgi:hypothetical protein
MNLQSLVRRPRSDIGQVFVIEFFKRIEIGDEKRIRFQ